MNTTQPKLKKIKYLCNLIQVLSILIVLLLMREEAFSVMLTDEPFKTLTIITAFIMAMLIPASAPIVMALPDTTIKIKEGGYIICTGLLNLFTVLSITHFCFAFWHLETSFFIVAGLSLLLALLLVTLVVNEARKFFPSNQWWHETPYLFIFCDLWSWLKARIA